MNIIPLDHLFAFIAVIAAVVALPGPDMLLIGSSTLQAGRKAGAACLAGILTGVCGHLLMALLGISALILASPMAFATLKYVGVAYILYIACLVIRSTEGPLSLRKHGKQMTLWRYWRTGTITNLLNPKAAMFFLSLLPPFLQPSQPIAPQLLMLGAVVIAVSGSMYTVMILLLARVGTKFSQSTRAQAIQKYATAILLVIAALYLLA